MTKQRTETTTTATEDTTTTEPAVTTPNAPEVTGNPTEPQDDATEGQTGSDNPAGEDQAVRSEEAKRYRLRLRQTEAERDELRQTNTDLAGRLETMQRAEVERVAADHLAAGDAVWLAGADLADMLDEAGQVDAAKVQQVCQTATAERPYLGRPAVTATDVGIGVSGGQSDTSSSWQEALQS